MATLVDLSLTTFFGNIFMFLFVFAVSYGVLSVSKIFKGAPWEKGLYSLISLVIGLVVSITRQTFTFVASLVPWFAAVIILLFLSFMVVRMFVGDNDQFFADLMKKQAFVWVILVIIIIIVLSSLSNTFGQELLDQGSGVESDSREELLNDGVSTIDVDSVDDRSAREIITENAAQPGATSTGDFSDNVLATLVHPKVLGLLMLMLIGFFTLLLVARTQDPDAK